MSALTIWHGHDQRQLNPDQQLTFGRRADLVLDENLHLHRKLGLVQFADGVWWLSNVGRNITMRIYDQVSPSTIKLAPGATVALGFEGGLIRFDAGTKSYEVGFRLATAPEVPNQVEPGPGQRTARSGDLTLNPEQHLMVIALAENRLRNPDTVLANIPANRQVASSLGWTLTKFNRKLDNLCRRLDRQGIKGMRGDISSLANNRRELLVEYFINQGVVTVGDLKILDRFREDHAGSD